MSARCVARALTRQEIHGMKTLLALGVGAFAAFWLSPSQADASTLTDCLAQQHVCVTGDSRHLVSAGQQAQLEQRIGGDGIYLAVAPSGSLGYNSAMNQIIGALIGHAQFTVGFLDSRRMHFGAYSKGILPSGDAANIATRVVKQHQADQNVSAALMDFVKDVQHDASSGSGAAAAGAPSHVLRNVLIAAGVIVVLGVLGFFLIARPIRRRRQRELKEAKSAAQDDLIALSAGITDHHADLSIQTSPEAAEEQAAAVSAYERGTAALDAATRATDMEAVSDVYWTPADGGPGRSVPACSACAHQVEQGIEPDMRTVEVRGTPVSYVNAGFAPAYWGGYGFGPGLFTGFLLGQALAPYPIFADNYSSGEGDSGGGDFGGGDFGGGDFGGGDF